MTDIDKLNRPRAFQSSLQKSVEAGDADGRTPVWRTQLSVEPLKPAVDGFGLQVHVGADDLAAVAGSLMTQEVQVCFREMNPLEQLY